MNSGPVKCSCSWLAWSVGVLGSFLVIGGLAWLLVIYSRPAAPGEDRVALRRKNLRELRAIEAEVISHYGWVDPAKGIVRLPVSRAIELSVQEMADPAAARASRIARVEKATEKPPEVKSAFE